MGLEIYRLLLKCHCEGDLTVLDRVGQLLLRQILRQPGDEDDKFDDPYTYPTPARTHSSVFVQGPPKIIWEFEPELPVLPAAKSQKLAPTSVKTPKSRPVIEVPPLPVGFRVPPQAKRTKLPSHPHTAKQTQPTSSSPHLPTKPTPTLIPSSSIYSSPTPTSTSYLSPNLAQKLQLPFRSPEESNRSAVNDGLLRYMPFESGIAERLERYSVPLIGEVSGEGVMSEVEERSNGCGRMVGDKGGESLGKTV